MSETTQWHPALASTVANHFEEAEEFQRQQKDTLGDVLTEIIDIIGLPPGGPYGRGTFKGVYSVSNLLDRIRELSR